MILTKDQEAGLRMAVKLKEFKDQPRIAVLAGYAGTGKTTMLRRIAEEMGYPRVVAPTGKAAIRVKEATGIHALTIHSWMYSAEEDDMTGEVEYSLKRPDEIEVSNDLPLVVIDEASMVGLDLWEDIFEVCVIKKQNILIVGDPEQLPPVQKTEKERHGQSEEFSLLSPRFACHERVMLTEIVRQALENPIIRASMLIREGKAAEAVFSMQRINPATLIDSAARTVAGGGVVICHTNATRNKMNVAVRGAMGKMMDRIEPGEPLLVLQNNYRLMRFNGEVTKFESWVDPPAGKHKIRDWIRKQEAESRYGIAKLENTDADKKSIAILCEEQVFGRLEHVTNPPIVKTSRIIYGGGVMTPEMAFMSPEERERAMGYPFMHCNFGYVMTAHKSQGSEWPNVLVVVEQSVRLGQRDGQRWFYTAVTRARDNVQLCLGAKV